VMDHLAPVGGVYQAGTLSGNPVAVAAGLAQLRLIDTDTHERLEAVTVDLVAALDDALSGLDRAVHVQRHGTLAGLTFRDGPPRDASDVAEADHEAYARFFHAMLDEGVYLAPSGHEIIFSSLAIGPDEVERVHTAATRAATRI